MESIMIDDGKKIKNISTSNSSTSNASLFNQDAETFICRERGAVAFGRWDKQGRFLLLKGSVTAYRSHSKTRELVDKLYAEQAKKLNGNKVIEDIAFSSPSRAAFFAAKASVNGNAAWLTPDGERLGDYCERLGKPAPNAVVDSDAPLSKIAFYCMERGANAKGYYIPESQEFVVMRGSTVSPRPIAIWLQGRLSKSAESRRAWEEHGIYLADNSVFKCDAIFSTSSAAESFVTHRHANGPDVWVDQYGVSLGERLRELA